MKSGLRETLTRILCCRNHSNGCLLLKACDSVKQVNEIHRHICAKMKRYLDTPMSYHGGECVRDAFDFLKNGGGSK